MYCRKGLRALYARRYETISAHVDGRSLMEVVEDTFMIQAVGQSRIWSGTESCGLRKTENAHWYFVA